MIIFSSFVILLLLLPVLIENEEKMTSKKYTPQEIARLILLCWHGEADKQQMTELEEWLEESADNRSFYESLGARSYQGTEWQEYMKYDSRKDWKRVKVAMKRRKRVPFRYLLPYAALVLIAIGLAWMIKYKNTGKSEQPVSMVETIRPGSSKAQLVLPDGRRVDLEVDRGCQQLKGENFVNDGKQLVYHEQENGKRIQWHTLSVPRGGEYKLVLAVGNVLSEILYDFVPGHTRIVGILAVEIIVIVFAGAFHLFFGVHQEVIMIIDILVFIQGYVCLEVNVDLAFVTGILGCYNNDSVCGARTVDSRRCSVFQNVHRSDVIGIEVFDRAFDRKTVHNEQRAKQYLRKRLKNLYTLVIFLFFE